MRMTSVVRRAKSLSRLASEENGQAMVEYALLISLVAVVSFGAVNAFGGGVSSLYSTIVAHFPH